MPDNCHTFLILETFFFFNWSYFAADGIGNSTIVNSGDGLGTRMGGQESINEKLRRAVGSKLMDCFFGPQPLKGATALCCAGTRTLPHSTLCRAQELLAVFHVTSERLQGTAVHIPQPPLCPQARVLVYIVAHRILYSYIVPIFRSRTLICKCFISPLYGRSFYFALTNLLT